MKSSHYIVFNNGYKIYLSFKKTFWQRLKGLLGEKKLMGWQGVVLVGSKQIHTLGMKFPIDIVVMDKENRVIDFVGNFQPNRISRFYRNAKYIIELGVGEENKKLFKIGEKIVFAKLI